MIVWLVSGIWQAPRGPLSLGLYYGVWLIVERFVSRHIYPERWLGTTLSERAGGCFWAIAIFTHRRDHLPGSDLW